MKWATAGGNQTRLSPCMRAGADSLLPLIDPGSMQKSLKLQAQENGFLRSLEMNRAQKLSLP
jgi:hypothetical protein